MLRETMTYTDFDGNERTETFMFNLTKAEIAEMELTTSGGFVAYLEKIVQEMDPEKLVTTFKELILKSYGVKSADGKQFVKNQELRDAFASTEAYSDLFMKLATNAEAAAAFVNGVIPKASK